MLAAVAILPFLVTVTMLALFAIDTWQQEGAKIVAALKGRSWAAEPVLATRPVTVRFSGRGPVQRVPVRAQAGWRAAA
ncbi:hypothetical protein HMF7854_09655 [Sphingomonas ginkgonis]|uniref:Uncharacterized protein n=1 Tax=Sphingomonas ginkgonis TaxID=2315330 RepID=A0A3R9Y6A9_9SPHN|nr:hypothetical protein [Sphingomonas ginkgonis]RST31072.1 hypothetical protein HMF7854_09655 [Sphingomonas ginkgonis]